MAEVYQSRVCFPLYSRDLASVVEEMNILQRELKNNAQELEETSSRNASMVHVLSVAIPTLSDLLNNVSSLLLGTLLTAATTRPTTKLKVFVKWSL